MGWLPFHGVLGRYVARFARVVGDLRTLVALPGPHVPLLPLARPLTWQSMLLGWYYGMNRVKVGRREMNRLHSRYHSSFREGGVAGAFVGVSDT